MRKNVPSTVRLILIIMLIAGAVMCALWLPSAVAYLENSCPALEGCETLLYLGFGIVAIPVFAVFFMAFAFIPAFEQDSIFDKRTARLIKHIAYIILSDCAVFGVMMGVVMCLGERVLSPLLIFISLIGLTVSVVLMILADHVDRASELKEEVEGTL